MCEIGINHQQKTLCEEYNSNAKFCFESSRSSLLDDLLQRIPASPNYGGGATEDQDRVT